MYIYIYIYTHTHTYIYIYTPAGRGPLAESLKEMTFAYARERELSINFAVVKFMDVSELRTLVGGEEGPCTTSPSSTYTCTCVCAC